MSAKVLLRSQTVSLIAEQALCMCDFYSRLRRPSVPPDPTRPRLGIATIVPSAASGLPAHATMIER